MATIDLQDTRTLLAVIEREYKPTTALVDIFFPNVKTFVTDTVDVEYRKGDRKMAPFIVPGSKGVNVAREGSNIRVYKAPIMRPKRVTAAEDILKRGFGEDIYSKKTPAERAAEIRVKDLKDLIDMCTRRQEWLAAQLLLNGGYDIEGYADDGAKTVTDTLTFGDVSTYTADWSDASTADVYNDLGDAAHKIRKAAGLNPTVAVMGYDVVQYILKNEQLLKYLAVPSRENLALANIQPALQRNDIFYVGRILSIGLDLYAYEGGFTNDKGEFEAYIPEGKVILGVPGRGKRLFGAVTQVEPDGNFATYAAEYVPKVTASVEDDVTTISVASRCVICPEMAEDWAVLDVLTAAE